MRLARATTLRRTGGVADSRGMPTLARMQMPSCSPKMGGLRGLLAAIAAAAVLTAALAGAGAPSASAAEPGVNLIGSTAAQLPTVQALGTHWVRMFATWPDLEPSQGTFSTFWLAYYEETF